jgi:perosamine synthetase
MEKLAIHGGTPVRTGPLPTNSDASGRDLGDEELRELEEVVRSGRLNRGVGTKVSQLEKEFAAWCGRRHATASTSGTAAIHVALGALNLEPGDEVITTPITDMGTVIPILLQNCVPVFADVDPETLCMDPVDLARRITPKTRAVIPIHLVGFPCDMEPILALARERNLAVIEDACQAYGARYRGRLLGTLGDFGCFSLQQSKHITTGDGGLTIADDDRLGERAALFANKGWPHYGQGGRDYVCFGVNYRMTELQAAVARAQLRKLDGLVAARVRAAERITAGIEGLTGVSPPARREWGSPSYWFYSLRVQPERLKVPPAEFARALSAEGVPAGAGYIGKPIFLYDLLRGKQVYGTSRYPWDAPQRAGIPEPRYEPGECPGAEQGLRELIVLPLNEFFSDADCDAIAAAVRKVARALVE